MKKAAEDLFGGLYSRAFVLVGCDDSQLSYQIILEN